MMTLERMEKIREHAKNLFNQLPWASAWAAEGAINDIYELLREVKEMRDELMKLGVEG